LSDERSYHAELHRLKGELLLAQPAARAVAHSAGAKAGQIAAFPVAVHVENCFSESIRIAQRHQAISLELRSVLSLARFYQTQGKRKQAQSLLIQICNRFSEGHGMPDLREAKTLIDDLSQSSVV